MRSARHHISGFTLMEVMVSLVIMSIVIALVVSALGVGIRSWDRGSQHLHNMRQKELVESVLKKQLVMALAMKGRGPATAAGFRGSATTMEFATRYSMMSDAVDWRSVKYAVDGEGQFTYSERLLYNFAPLDADSGQTKAFGSFSRVRFRYLEPIKNGFQWVEEWPDTSAFPEAVEVRLDDDELFLLLRSGSQ